MPICEIFYKSPESLKNFYQENEDRNIFLINQINDFESVIEQRNLRYNEIKSQYSKILSKLKNEKDNLQYEIELLSTDINNLEAQRLLNIDFGENKILEKLRIKV